VRGGGRRSSAFVSGHNELRLLVVSLRPSSSCGRFCRNQKKRQGMRRAHTNKDKKGTKYENRVATFMAFIRTILCFKAPNFSSSIRLNS
jgi:hypothetical protein